MDYAKKISKFNLYFDITGQQSPLIIGFFADYALEEPLKVCLWIDAVEPTTLRKRKDEGCIFSSILTFPHADSADPYIIDVLKICGNLRIL